MRQFFWTIRVALGVALLVLLVDEKSAPMAFGIVFIVGILISIILDTKCPKCGKYLCVKEYGHEDLSRDVVSKRVKDKELGTQLEHYAVGKRKHYYKCNKCGYESTSIKDYKDKIDV